MATKTGAKRGTRTSQHGTRNHAEPSGDGHSGTATSQTESVSATKRRRESNLAQQSAHHDSPGNDDRGVEGGHWRDSKPSEESTFHALDDLYRHKRFLLNTRQAVTLPAYALARSMLRVGKIENAKERAAACKVAKDIVDSILDNEKYDGEQAIRDIISSRIEPIGIPAQVASIQSKIKDIEKVMVSIVEKMPIAEWAKTVRGFGMVNLTGIIANAGDIGGYSSFSALHNRFGLARPDSYKTITKSGKTANAVPRERRALMFVVGDCLIKNNFHPKPKDAPEEYERVPCEYRAEYVEAKVKYREAHPDFTDMHVHRMAQRKMEKLFMKNLYRAWRDMK